MRCRTMVFENKGILKARTDPEVLLWAVHVSTVVQLKQSLGNTKRCLESRGYGIN